MCSKFCLLLLAVATLNVHADERIKLKLKERGGPDVLSESRLLQLTNESGIQRAETPSTRGYAISLGELSAGQLKVITPDTHVDYNLRNEIPLLRFSYLNLPWNWHGQWGFQASVGYGFKEHLIEPKAILHMVPVTAEALYRRRSNDGRLWAPQAGLGFTEMVYFQRGSTKLNTSEASEVMSASVGLWWGIGRWLEPKSPVPMDLTASYSRLFALSRESESWSGQIVQLALGVGL